MPTHPLRLFVASIGNPAPYLGTLHSAGHTVLKALQVRLSQEPFRKAARGQVSAGSAFTLFQSAALTNASGPAVLAGWKAFVQDGGRHGALVVLHDELGMGWGEVGVRSGDLSARGHNGLKSVKESLAGAGAGWVRIGLGIGRPVSRDPDVVAAYVLKKFTPEEKGKLEACVGAVEAELRRIRGE